MYYVLSVAVVLVLVTVLGGVRGVKNGISKGKAMTFLGLNLTSFFAIMIGAAVLMLSGGSASAAEAGTAVANSDGLKYLGAALSTGLACIGTGVAVGITCSAAIGAISEDEKLLGKTMIFVGLAEGIAIYGLIISIMILGS